MTTTTEGSLKLDRKSLGKPDSFTAYFKKLIGSLQKHRGVQLGMVGAVVALVAIIALVSGHRTEVSQAGMDQVYLARQAHDKELTAAALLMPPSTPPAKPAKVDPKAPAPAAPTSLSPELARYAKLDVDAKFPEALSAYKKIIAAHPGTLAALQSNLAIGDLYFDHGSAERSIEFYRAAEKDAPTKFHRMLAGYSLASSLYETGKYDDAANAASSALKTGANEMKGELLLLTAQIQEKKKDFAGARKTYEQIEKDRPTGPEAALATHRKSLLPSG